MSPKHRTTSKSGNSPRSTTKATSRQTVSSSKNAPASFDEVMGKSEPAGLSALRQLETATMARLVAHKTSPAPTLALYRARYKQRLARLEKHLENIREAISTANADKDNS